MQRILVPLDKTPLHSNCWFIGFVALCGCILLLNQVGCFVYSCLLATVCESE